MLKPIISPEELVSLNQKKPMIIIDARGGMDARERFSRQHLSGAQHVHLEEDLSEIRDDYRLGGRHPLPGLKSFSLLLGKLGITPDSHVITCDEQSGANAAARCWWMLRAAGHDKVQVLNGGMQAALAAGFPAGNTPVPSNPKPPYPVTETWNWPLVSMDEVDEYIYDPKHIIVDVREEERYLGIHEPIDTIAGRIPGAVNMPYPNNLDQQGFMHPPAKIRTAFQEILGCRPVARMIVHCGSGVTACHTILAMAYAGMEIPAIYTGSWSEWSRNGKPMEKGPVKKPTPGCIRPDPARRD